MRRSSRREAGVEVGVSACVEAAEEGDARRSNGRIEGIGSRRS
jgi:hypothetical protein